MVPGRNIYEKLAMGEGKEVGEVEKEWALNMLIFDVREKYVG